MKLKNVLSKCLAVSLITAMGLNLTGCGSSRNSGSTTVAEEKTEESIAGESEKESASDNETAAYSGGSYTLQLGHIGAAGSIEETVANRFAELVSEMSDGNIEVTIYGNSQMGGLTDLVDAIRYDTLDMAIFAMGNIDSYFPLGNVIAMPYLITDYDQAEAMYESDFYRELVNQCAETTNCRELGAFHVGFRVILSTVPITSASDMQGVTIRVPESTTFVTTFTALGCNTIAIPASEVYQALQTGLVEATEAAPSYMTSMNYQEVSKYCSPTNHIYTCNGLYISQNKLDSLDDEAAAVIEAAGAQAAQEVWTIVEEEDEKAMQAIENAGVEVLDVDIDSFRTAMEDVWTKLGIDDIDGGRDLMDNILSLAE